MEISQLCRMQRAYFDRGETLQVDFRMKTIKTLREWIEAHTDAISQALQADLGKSACEAYMTEIGMVLEEISYMLTHVRRFACPKRVRTPLAQFLASSYTLPKPYGCVLIMSPWNYPFLLTVGPLVDALAAGNTVIIKPSAYAPATSRLLVGMARECFASEHVAVIEGGRKENAALLEERFDVIFFTGSKAVGRLVMEKAARYLTPVILELGGKSPCIVDETANIRLAARRIVFGKYLNAGQTCVAPDYVLVQERVRRPLIEALRKEITAQLGKEPLENPEYGRIVNQKHFERLTALIDAESAVWGGARDAAALRIAPALLEYATMDSPAMQDEIFGPLLPVLSFEQLEEVPRLVARHPTPLAMYIFTQSRQNAHFLQNSISFGGGCINDTVIHLASTHMGFGGVGESGMGSYHGRKGFDAFTHYASIVDKSTLIDLPIRYQPYTNKKQELIRRFMK